MKHQDDINTLGLIKTHRKYLMKHFKKNLGKQLRKIRLELNYSLTTVSGDTGISKSTIGEMEHGNYITLEHLWIFANYYGMEELNNFFASLMK